jgi:hypothetical protein
MQESKSLRKYYDWTSTEMQQLGISFYSITL